MSRRGEPQPINQALNRPRAKLGLDLTAWMAIIFVCAAVFLVGFRLLAMMAFRNAYVFDISQTNGVDLPNLHEVSGDPGESIERLSAFLKGKGIQLVYSEKIAPALGMSYGGRIAILPGQSKAEEFSTLVHETAHELLHKAERRTATTKTVRETEAEAVAFVVGKAVGLVTGNASADYIHLYHGNASLLTESLEVIQQTASVILSALEPPMQAEDSAPATDAHPAGVAA
jgi:type IV secretory system VirB3-like protein